ncbi:MAG: hypothetical protein ACFFD2_27660, partial [Promethearchaeota archaeon]
SPRSFLKSYSKLNFQIFEEGPFKLGVRNMLGKVSFNECNFQLINKIKEVKKNMGKRNDDRSNSMNPNNPAYQASLDNRSNQLNPNNPEYKDDDD